MPLAIRFPRTSLLVLCALLFTPLAHAGEGETPNGLLWSDDGAQVTITGYTAALTPVLTVPATINGLPVRSIDAFAFSECPVITDLVLPNGLQTIGQFAFYRCPALRSVSVPGSVTTLRRQVFADCDALTEVNLSPGLYIVEKEVFDGCGALQTITFPEGVIQLGAAIFYGCSQLQTVNLPSTLKTIEGEAFVSCHALRTFTLPDGLTFLGERAFYACTNLESITFPPSLKQIQSETFLGCEKLANVSLSEGLDSIGTRAFFSAPSLRRITFPASLKSIWNSAFSFCDALESAEFLGNAPTNFEPYIFDDAAPNFSIYYQPGATGFAAPTWKGYAATQRIWLHGLFPILPQKSSGPAWYFSPWYGWMLPSREGFIWHLNHGNQYVTGTNPNALYAYDYGLKSWIYTTPTLYRWIYSYRQGAWLLHAAGSTTPKRWFYVSGQGWKQEPELQP